MNRWIYSTAAKAVGVLLLVINLIMFIAGCTGIVIMGENGFFDQPLNTIRQKIYDSITTNYNYRVHSDYYDGNFNPEDYLQGTGYYFEIKDSEGKVILTNYNGEAVQYSKDTTTSYLDEKTGKTTELTITGYAAENVEGTKEYGRAEYWITKAYNMRYLIVALTIMAAVISIVLFIYLMCTSGYKAKGEKPEPGLLEKLPFDVYTVLMIMFAALQIASGPGIVFLIIFGAIDAVLIILYLMSFAVRVRTVGVIKKTLIYKILSFILRIIGYVHKNLSLVWKTVIGVFFISILELIGLARYGGYGEGVSLWFLEKLLLVPIIIYIAISLRKLQKGGEAIAGGDLSHKIDTGHMLWDFKKHGENLNNISNGMSAAVDERMKSERLKTELITNVSHDIKTPLTSIINYVDLIKKEDVDNKTVQEYVEVLDRQSSRLKKLIEDLVEASKASTGNIRVNMAPCEIGVLLNQMQGEYEDKLKTANLELIINQPEEQVTIMADGRHMWRVLDNLMNNICKYAQPGTRVYVLLTVQGGRAVVTFKNVSRYELNISADELMERFVRGDTSRNTEGSGLGLSIAKSLTELQKGKLELSIDGDLFKAILSFSLL